MPCAGNFLFLMLTARSGSRMGELFEKCPTRRGWFFWCAGCSKRRVESPTGTHNVLCVKCRPKKSQPSKPALAPIIPSYFAEDRKVQPTKINRSRKDTRLNRKESRWLTAIKRHQLPSSLKTL